MQLDELEKKLFAAARALPPNVHVPYAFEKRIMAALAEHSPIDLWAAWSRWLWRAAAPCVAVMLATGAWTVLTHQSTGPDALAADLEQAVLAPLSSLQETW